MEQSPEFCWGLDTQIILPEHAPAPVVHAARILKRDMGKTLSPGGADFRIEVSFAVPGEPSYRVDETFSISFDSIGRTRRGKDDGPMALHLSGADELGIVYGLLYLSRQFLGVDPWWFWMDKEPHPLGVARIPTEPYCSTPYGVRYRGWFVNDEDSLIGWTDTYPPPEEVWLTVFEALLRLGGNLVIPGTDLPRSGGHYELAAEMGLYVTFHHAESLGAEMFKRAHPDLEARYDKYPERFQALWREAIERGRSRKTVWTLGFRGQGDKPFWEDDPVYETPGERGRLIGSAIEQQREMLIRMLGDGEETPPTCVYIYGELTELYRDGHLHFPPSTIRIWADNGYGKMVSRRQGNVNERLPSLPEPEDHGKHGLYYHVAFHDLQASNHLTMFPSEATLIRDELRAAIDRGADRLLLLNSANVRPHTYFLDLVSEMWRLGDVDTEAHRRDFCERFFPSAPDSALRCLEAYPRATIPYGPNPDDRAGEEYYHHCARSLISTWMRGEEQRGAEDMQWATGNLSLGTQFAGFAARLKPAVAAWQTLTEQADAAAELMSPEESERFRDFFCFQAGLHSSGSSGFVELCNAYAYFADHDFPRSFVAATSALREYRQGLELLETASTGKWSGFFRCDYLTNVAATVYAVDSLRRWLRQFGDAPDYYRWYRAHVVPPSERGILLENTTRRVLSDDELADALAAVFDSNGQER